MFVQFNLLGATVGVTLQILFIFSTANGHQNVLLIG